MYTFAALRMADDLCWLCAQGTKEIGATTEITAAVQQAHQEVLQHLQPHAINTTIAPDGTVILQFEDGALRGKGLCWHEETPALNAHRERLAKAVCEALRSAEETAPSDARFAQAEVGHCLFNLDGTLANTEDDGKEDSLIKQEYIVAFEDGTSLNISGYGHRWWFGQLYQEGYGEAISPEAITA